MYGVKKLKKQPSPNKGLQSHNNNNNNNKRRHKFPIECLVNLTGFLMVKQGIFTTNIKVDCAGRSG
jgi:hypothetical protein